MRVYTKSQTPQGAARDCDSHAPLVNYAKNDVSRSGVVFEKEKARKKDLLRESRFIARELLWSVSTIGRVKCCGRVGVRLGGSVGVRATAGDDGQLTAGFAGLYTCGSVWACPVCSARIQAQRREEVQLFLDFAEEHGFTVVMGTQTIRHKRADLLGQSWAAMAAAWRMVTANRVVRTLRGNLRADLRSFDGIHPNTRSMSYIRAQEVTWSEVNGWHPHAHTLYLLKGDVTDAEIQHLADVEFAAWRAALSKMGQGEPLRERYELKRVKDKKSALSDYFAKAEYHSVKTMGNSSAAFEIASSATKKGRKKSLTPFQIFEEFQATGNMDYLDLWGEYELVSKGRHALDWSRGLKTACGVTDTSDEDIAAQEIGSKDDECFVIADWWRDVVAPGDGGRVAAGLLACIETAGVAAGRDYCADYGIEIMEPHAAAARAGREHRERLGARSTAADDADAYVMADPTGHNMETRIMSLALEWRSEIIEHLTRDNLAFFDETVAWLNAMDEWNAYLYRGHKLPSDVLKEHPSTELDRELQAYYSMTGVAFDLPRALQIHDDE